MFHALEMYVGFYFNKTWYRNEYPRGIWLCRTWIPSRGRHHGIYKDHYPVPVSTLGAVCRILLLYVLLGKIYFVTDSLLNVFRTSKLVEENEIDIFYGDQFIPSILCVCFLENCLYNHISVFFLMKR